MSLQSLVDATYNAKVKNNRTVQIKPNRDESDIYVLGASNEEDMLNQLSLFMAIKQLVNNDFDFDEWADDFELGYPGKATGYPEGSPYGNSMDNRPKIIKIGSTAGNEANSKDVTVKFKPDRDADESYIFTGSKSEVRQSIILFFNTWLSSKSSDSLNAYYPLDEYLRSKPRDYIALQMWFTPKKDWSSSARPSGWKGVWKTYHYTIPAINLPLQWEVLKSIAGGESGITIGKHTARGYLGRLNDGKSLKGATQLVISSNSANSALSELKRIANYSQLEILKASTHEESFAKYGTDKVDFLRVYPAWCVFMSSKLIDSVTKSGRQTLQGQHITKRMRVSLKKRPFYYDELMAKLTED